MTGEFPLQLAFFGDDFTGSTDALEVVTRAGLRVELFLDVPTQKELASRGELQAVGVAGATRSLSPLEMEGVLKPTFRALQQLRPRHVHYKVCSTFDSSPQIGSIGKAIDVGSEVFRSRWIPLVVGAPELGRYCLFGNLFARMGIGSAGKIFRLDRHPAMSRHPVTPAAESDLRVHLAAQTGRRIELLDVLALNSGEGKCEGELNRMLAGDAAVVLFDTLDDSHLLTAGRLIDSSVTSEPLFSVGSSGLDSALCRFWERQGSIRPRTTWSPASEAQRCLVLSGSCSPVTAGQIKWAEVNGFQMIQVDPVCLDPEPLVQQLLPALSRGHTVVYTSQGEATATVSPASLGAMLGRLARVGIEQGGVRRVLVAGGDTSSYTGRALGIRSLSMAAPLAPGAPLCRIHATDSALEGVEINFKGGQVGAPDYFGAVVRGRL